MTNKATFCRRVTYVVMVGHLTSNAVSGKLRRGKR